MLTKLISSVRRLVGDGRPIATPLLHDPPHMWRSLERERARADRSGTAFSVLTLSIPRGGEGVADTIRELRRIVPKRIRITDEAGWLGRGRLAVILPCTSPRGAWTLADDICLAFPADIALPVCQVFVYPFQRGGEDGGEQDEFAPSQSQPPARTMEPLFMRPLPLWKRGLDIVGASVGLVLLAPVMLVIALVIKITSPGPIFYCQTRKGHGGRRFWCYKFRTMYDGAEALKRELRAKNEVDGPVFKLRYDPRVTRFGRFLRETSLDELPQLFNVLWGDMSLVGPRPLEWAEAENVQGWLRQRTDVTPGLTCIWQVYGRSRVTFTEWVRMDMRYMRRRTLWQDLFLIVETVRVLASRRTGM